MEKQVISEQQARALLRENKIERGFDPKTCYEIAQERGLLPVASDVEIVPVNDSGSIEV